VPVPKSKILMKICASMPLVLGSISGVGVSFAASAPVTAAPAKHRALPQSNPATEPAPASLTPAKPAMNPAVLDVIEARRIRCESTMAEVRWAGSCKNGFRDGQGTEVYEYKSQYSASHTERRGTYVEGIPAGWSCTTVDITAFEGKVSTRPSLVGACGLAIPYVGTSWSPLLRRRANGEWHLDDSRDDFPRPDPAPIIVDGTALEQANASLIRAAQEGHAAGKIELPLQSSMLADLLPEGRSTLLIDPDDPADVSGKRVAVVLSSQSLKEMERWRAARDEFARTKAYGVLAAPTDAAFLTQLVDKGDASKLLASLVSTLRTVAGSVVPAEDLSPLTRGEADYAVVVDWRFDGGYSDPKQFGSRPRGITDATRLTLAQQLKFLLFDQKLRVRLASVDNDTNSDVVESDRDNAAYMPGIRNWNPVAAKASSVGSYFRGNLITLMSPEDARHIGDNFLNGNGVPKDESVASAAYSAGAANGDALSMFKLAQYDDIQSHSYPDIYRKSALEWYTRAAKFGNWNAAAVLSVIYMKGTMGMPKDNQKVLEYGRLAYANERNGTTANNLGFYYQHGLGVDPDPKQAAEYFREALGFGYPDAQKELDEIGPQLASLEAADSFAADLEKVSTPAQLYALGDEQATKGDHENARLAFRAILTRFPNSALAASAAQRLGALGSN
jgi:TPR repeat protein